MIVWQCELLVSAPSCPAFLQLTEVEAASLWTSLDKGEKNRGKSLKVTALGLVLMAWGSKVFRAVLAGTGV